MAHKMDNKVLPPLLRLPPELLDYVFKLAYEDEKPTEPLCRALLPFHTRVVYRDVHLRTRKEVILFRHAVTKQQEYGSMTRSLLLDLFDEGSNGVVDPGNPVNLLKRLPQLRRLVLQDVEPTIIRLFLQGVHALRLPLLSQMELLPARSVDLPEEIQVTTLISFPSLNDLTLSVEYFPDHFFLLSTSPLASVRRLVLGERSYDDYSDIHLAALFPNLDALTLADNDSWPNYRRLLLTAPTTLTNLILSCVADPVDGQIPGLDLTAVLPRFPFLQHLELCQYTFDHTTILPVLQSYAYLRHLVFGPCAPVPDDLLLSIVQGPTKLQQLQRLTLDHVTATRGKTIQDHDWELSPEADYTDGHTFPGWTAPAWNDDSSEAGLSDVIRAGLSAGILVDGSALLALGWEEEHSAEVFRCTMSWCCSRGDFIEAKQLYGACNVSEWLKGAARFYHAASAAAGRT